MYFYEFPYEEVERGSRIIIAGAGSVGQCFVKQIMDNDYCDIVAITDRNYRHMKAGSGIKIVSPERIKNFEYDKIIMAVTQKWKENMLEELKKVEGVDREKIYWKKYPAHRIETSEYEIVKTVFDILNEEHPSYIDVGACHPHMSSDTLGFYLRGSRGINIEPEQSLKEEFKRYRARDINLFLGVAAEEGEMDFYRSTDPYLSTFSVIGKDYSEKHYKAIYSNIEKVAVVTLNHIVDKYCDGIFPDFLDIDIEGMDAEVLRSCDFSHSAPKVICIERKPDECARILAEKSENQFVPYCRLNANTIYLRQDIYNQVFMVE